MNIDNMFPVLLNGPSGSGKTSTAKTIVWPEDAGLNTIFPRKHGETNYVMNTYALAGPLAEMHSIKQNTTGREATQRQLWLIESVCGDLIPKFSCSFDDYIELVYDIVSYPLDPDVLKDRNFYNTIADRCHHIRRNVFAEALVRKIKTEARMLEREYSPNTIFIPVISDLRVREELDHFVDIFGSNVYTIRLETSEDVRSKRIEKRGDQDLTEEQKNHYTAKDNFQDFEFDLRVDTDSLALKDQGDMIRDFITDNVLEKTEYANANN